MINIGIIEPDNYQLEVLKDQINSQDELVCAIATKSVAEFLALQQPALPLLVILIGLTGSAPATELTVDLDRLKKQFLTADIIILTDDEKDSYKSTQTTVVPGFLPKNIDTLQLKEAILNVATGSIF